MAELVDALVSNTSNANCAGSTPAPGTCKKWLLIKILSAIFNYTNSLVAAQVAVTPLLVPANIF